MHLTTDEVQDMVSNLCDSPASFIYQYLRKYKHFSGCSARQCVTTWFSNPLWATDSSFNLITNRVITKSKSAQAVYNREMQKMGCVEIPAHLMKEIGLQMKSAEESTSLLELSQTGTYDQTHYHKFPLDRDSQ